MSVREFAVPSGYLHATWRAFEKHCAEDSARYDRVQSSHRINTEMLPRIVPEVSGNLSSHGSTQMDTDFFEFKAKAGNNEMKPGFLGACFPYFLIQKI